MKLQQIAAIHNIYLIEASELKHDYARDWILQYKHFTGMKEHHAQAWMNFGRETICGKEDHLCMVWVDHVRQPYLVWSDHLASMARKITTDGPEGLILGGGTIGGMTGLPLPQMVPLPKVIQARA